MSSFNSTVVQRKRILNSLHACPFGTLTVRKELDVIHLAACVMEVREEFHRVECYVLKAGAVAPAPANKADGIHRKETDKLENSMGSSL